MSPVPRPAAIDSVLPPVSDTAPPATWQRELAGAVRTTDDLLRRLGLILPNESFAQATQRMRLLERSAADGGLTDAGFVRDINLLQQFPVLVPTSFLNRMRHGDLADPLLKQVLPLQAESEEIEGFRPDAVGDLAARRAPGLLHKYHGRVLLIAASACVVHCRYCFRREYPYQEEPRRLDEWRPALDEIAADPTISEVIFSGGDPWMLNDQRLHWLCNAIDAIPHIERLRFHTRLPIVLPSRVTDELLSMLAGLRAQPIVVVHANHANEIAGDCESGLRRLTKSGVPVLNQSVLLAGINDSVDALESLSRRLIRVGVMPYYLHHLDHVRGTAHFEVQRAHGQELLRQLATRLPGYAVPRYVQEIPGEPGKTPI